MKKPFLLFFCICAALCLNAQSNPSSVVSEFFNQLELRNERLNEMLFDDVNIISLGKESDLQTGIVDLIEDSKLPYSFKHQLGDATVSWNNNLASIWVPYHFYKSDKYQHCGSYLFTLLKDKIWRVKAIVDQRNQNDCPNLSVKSQFSTLDSLLDQWHLAASKADSSSFFGRMSKDGIYLGTDKTERWIRDEMADWAKPIFDKGKGWTFVKTERHFYAADDGKTVWFEELLNGWMGPVRGSGVLTLKDGNHQNNNWELRHYNLSLMVPNEKMNDVLKLIDEEKLKN